jgi:hypothetical protein
MTNIKQAAIFTQKDKYQVAYHYTNLDGFLAITEHKSFRLSNAYYLNDKHEIKWAIEKALRHFGKNETENRNLIEYLKYLNIHILDIFLISFTYNKNLLSQWRAYTNKGNGVSIGVDKDKLKIIAKDNNLILVDVAYDNEAHIEIIENLKRQFDSYVTGSQIPYETLNNVFLQEMIKIKSKEFQEEEEVRLVSENFNFYTDPKIKYFAKSNLLVPYIEIKFDKYECPFFHEVIVGPCQHFDLNWKVIQNRLSSTNTCNLVANSMSSFRSFE